MGQHTKTHKKWWQKIIFFYDWNLFEKLLLLVVSLGIIVFYILALAKPNDWSALAFLKDSEKSGYLFSNRKYRIALDTMTSLGGIVNIVCLLYTSKKRVSSFFVGIAAVVLLGVVAIIQGNMGSWILLLCVELPMNIIGYFMWRRASKDKITIAPRSLKWWVCLIMFVGIVALTTGAYFLFENEAFRKVWYLNPNINKEWYKVLIDASILIIGTTAMTLTLFRFKEIWYLWIVVDVVLVALNALESNWAIMFSYAGGLINSVYALFAWKTPKQTQTTSKK